MNAEFVPAPGEPDFRDMPEPASLIPESALPPAHSWLESPLLLAFAIFALLAFVFWIVKRCILPKKSSNPLTELERLRHFLEELPTQSDREVATACSLALRQFIHHRWKDDCLYETHEEFAHRIAGLSGLSLELRADLLKHLEWLERFKYHPESEQADAPRLRRHTLQLLDALSQNQNTGNH